ncbi:hypothetical protein EC973_008203 [Apophysomyces ossiformis]|uniref:Endoplasmic reticulum transmembrane protein n=1 Tax=Apophysomyces ossiformis TaxID=679940 RepID=A0A8H7BNK4_9FUNG|nr:hypothetical protein EC973_008203 [Apophysomyces ossiformis]
MTIYYTVTFFILVIEVFISQHYSRQRQNTKVYRNEQMFIFGMLVLPLPSHWRRAMLRGVTTSPLIAKAVYGLKIVMGFIFVLFIDTINRLQRIDAESQEEQHHHDYSFEASQKAKKFYAQRNLYLTGFTLFLSLILERTSTLVIQMLQREEELENMKKESLEVNKDQQRLIDLEKTYKKQVEELTQEVKELQKQERDFETLKKQVAQQSEEYNRLADERNALERAVKNQQPEGRKDI